MSNRHSIRLSTEQVAQALSPFGVSLSQSKLAAISRYVDTLLLWNKSVSITSLEDPMEIVARHFGESLFAASVVPINSGRLADVGTGGGFPGLPLKIAYPELEVLLLEANAKKCAFLMEIVGLLNLSGVQVSRSRYEEFPIEPGSLDLVCSRALGDYKRLLRWAREAMNRDGMVVLWLGTEDSIRVGRINGWVWDMPTKIPESRRRVILCGRILFKS